MEQELMFYFFTALLLFSGIVVIIKLTAYFRFAYQTSPGLVRGQVVVRENGGDDGVSSTPLDSSVKLLQAPTVIPVKDKVVPVSVNYHFTRKCNYKCGFCFHTAKTSFVLPLDAAKRGLQLLKDAGMEKINFSGGEPFIVKRGTFVGELVRFCKETLMLPSVSIVSNGSLIREEWFKKYGEYLDILAISCDSFDYDTNEKIGRQHGQRNHINSLLSVRRLCMEYKVAFKLNTVVNTYNKNEDMTEQIKQLDPCRWKVFQCLLIDGENAGQDALRNAETFVISDEEFDMFLDTHKSVSCLVPESNQKINTGKYKENCTEIVLKIAESFTGSRPWLTKLEKKLISRISLKSFETKMQNSYLILDEYMRFLDCTRGSKTPSRSLLDVGVDNALLFSGFDERMFFKRGGKYVWSKADMNLEW